MSADNEPTVPTPPENMDQPVVTKEDVATGNVVEAETPEEQHVMDRIAEQIGGEDAHASVQELAGDASDNTEAATAESPDPLSVEGLTEDELREIPPEDPRHDAPEVQAAIAGQDSDMESAREAVEDATDEAVGEQRDPSEQPTFGSETSAPEDEGDTDAGEAAGGEETDDEAEEDSEPEVISEGQERKPLDEKDEEAIRNAVHGILRGEDIDGNAAKLQEIHEGVLIEDITVMDEHIADLVVDYIAEGKGLPEGFKDKADALKVVRATKEILAQIQSIDVWYMSIPKQVEDFKKERKKVLKEKEKAQKDLEKHTDPKDKKRAKAMKEFQSASIKAARLISRLTFARNAMIVRADAQDQLYSDLDNLIGDKNVLQRLWNAVRRKTRRALVNKYLDEMSAVDGDGALGFASRKQSWMAKDQALYNRE